MAKIEDAAGKSGLFTDGDWILSTNMTAEGTIGIIQLKHIGVGEFHDKEFQFININTFHELGCTEVKPGDVLISRMAEPIGRACIVPRLPFRVVTAVDVSILRVDESVADNRFIMHLCNSPWVRNLVDRAARGTTRSRITRTELGETEIPLPSLVEQRRIAERLERAVHLCRTRGFALELTDGFIPAAFLKLFGDPGENTGTFDRVQVESLFEDSRGGAKCGPFGSALKKHEYIPQGIPVWTMNNVGANEFVEDGCLYITPQKFKELAAYDAQNGDILISRAGTVGRMAIVRTKHPKSIIHSNIIRLSLNHKKILPIYFVTLMTWFAPRIARLKRGQEDAYTFMSTGSLGELQIPLPPFPLQQKFAGMVEQVDHLRAVQREALRQADHLFQTLLYQAFPDH
jgi:type I restriction enzyme, S subunit